MVDVFQSLDSWVDAVCRFDRVAAQKHAADFSSAMFLSEKEPLWTTQEKKTFLSYRGGQEIDGKLRGQVLHNEISRGVAKATEDKK